MPMFSGRPLMECRIRRISTDFCGEKAHKAHVPPMNALSQVNGTLARSGTIVTKGDDVRCEQNVGRCSVEQ